MAIHMLVELGPMIYGLCHLLSTIFIVTNISQLTTYMFSYSVT